MTAMTHDMPLRVLPPRPHTGTGLVLALVAAVSFGMSGALAGGLLDTGWSVGAIVVLRMGIAAFAVLPFAVVALRGRWGLVRVNARLVTVYGLLGVAGAQFCFFSAIQYMQVGPALLIELTAPAAVVVWMWLRQGQRPGPTTLVGAGLAAVGLVLVLDLVSGADLSVAGVLWALGAMVGCATFYIVNGDESTGLPPIVLAGGGLLVGAVAIGVLGMVGLLPMHTSTATTTYAGGTFAWWQPIVVLALFTAALPYVTGVAASRILGSRLASFVGLNEVVAGVLWAWLLLGELPRTIQIIGGVLILAGVIGVKLGERSVVLEDPVPA